MRNSNTVLVCADRIENVVSSDGEDRVECDDIEDALMEIVDHGRRLHENGSIFDVRYCC